MWTKGGGKCEPLPMLLHIHSMVCQENMSQTHLMWHMHLVSATGDTVSLEIVPTVLFLLRWAYILISSFAKKMDWKCLGHNQLGEK